MQKNTIYKYETHINNEGAAVMTVAAIPGYYLNDGSFEKENGDRIPHAEAMKLRPYRIGVPMRTENGFAVYLTQRGSGVAKDLLSEAFEDLNEYRQYMADLSAEMPDIIADGTFEEI